MDKKRGIIFLWEFVLIISFIGVMFALSPIALAIALGFYKVFW